MNSGGENIYTLPHAQPPAKTGGNGGGNGDRLHAVELRLSAVEQRLAAIETEVRHLATKADIEAKFSSQLKWMIGVMIAATSALVLTIVRLMPT